VVQGNNVLTLRWTDGEELVPVDYRVYDKATDGLTKNDHFRAMLQAAKARGFAPARVAFDILCANLENLRVNRRLGVRSASLRYSRNRTSHPW
jgi:hypothetical protein